MTDAAVVIGRFQPFHRGHEHLLEYTLDRYDEVHVGIGIPDQEETFDNPLTYTEREQVVEACYPDVEVFGVDDKGDDAAWVREIELYVPDDVAAVTGNDRVAACFRAEGYDVDHLDEDDMLDRDTYRGTRIREKVVRDEAWQHLVPDETVDVLDRLGFGDRLKQV